jgi:hypothetical protein
VDPPARQWASPVVLTWLLVAGVSGALLLRATLAPPPGSAFVGTFYYVSDFYNYLSYVQQAEDGALVFRNKLASPDLSPALVNLEWLLVGWLSVLMGGAPILAYRLLGLFVLAAFVALVDRWLVRAGLPPPHRLAGLLLVFTGGGLGGVLVVTGWIPASSAYDVFAGFYPYVENLANAHFVAGTTLLVAALGSFAGRRPWIGAGLGTILAFVRPYDAALLAGVAGLGVLVERPPREWPRALVPVAALTPALAYDVWVFFVSPGFRIFSSPRYETFAPRFLVIALGPAALAALTVMGAWREGDEGARRHRLHLALWAALALLLALAKPVSFSLQFLTGVGVPLLVLGAIGLARLGRGVLQAAVPLFATTAVMVTWLQIEPNAYRDVPAERLQVAWALRSVCHPGELALAPSDIGLYVGGLSACWPWVSHSYAADHAARSAAIERFYSSPPASRGRQLEEICPTYVVVPATWTRGGLPAGAPYERRLEVEGTSGGLAVYSRIAGAPCHDALRTSTLIGRAARP